MAEASNQAAGSQATLPFAKLVALTVPSVAAPDPKPSPGLESAVYIPGRRSRNRGCPVGMGAYRHGHMAAKRGKAFASAVLCARHIEGGVAVEEAVCPELEPD